jgi:3-deoxy-manno-octulosonate cytidylyltransferase (CMP-KDO synthetase)
MKNDPLKVGLIIPARLKSKRLPGKPMRDIFGRSMIHRTWERCVKAVSAKQVYVATDSEVIQSHVRSFGGQCIMTSPECLTGTDRLAEANKKLDFDLVINVQGDEPIINPEDIRLVISTSLQNQSSIINAIAKIVDEEEIRSLTIPKVAKTIDNSLLYMSRSPIPGSKSGRSSFAYKQICIYAFPKAALRIFSENPCKTPFEESEDIEILRFLELGQTVKLVEVSGTSIAVDTETDLYKVRSLIEKIEIDDRNK